MTPDTRGDLSEVLQLVKGGAARSPSAPAAVLRTQGAAWGMDVFSSEMVNLHLNLAGQQCRICGPT